MELINTEGRYYQIKHKAGMPPRLVVKGGDVFFWVQHGPAHENGFRYFEGTVFSSGNEAPTLISLPLSGDWKIYSIFIEGLKPGTRIHLQKMQTHVLDESGKERPLPNHPPLRSGDVIKNGKTYKHLD